MDGRSKKYVDELAKLPPFGVIAYDNLNQHLRLKVRNDFADEILETFGNDVSMIPYDKNHFTVSVYVQLSFDFMKWLAYNIEQVEIIYPEQGVDLMWKYILHVAFTMSARIDEHEKETEGEM